MNDVSVALFINIKYGDVVVKKHPVMNNAMLFVGLWTNWDWKCYRTVHTGQTWPLVTIVFLGQ